MFYFLAMASRKCSCGYRIMALLANNEQVLCNPLLRQTCFDWMVDTSAQGRLLCRLMIWGRVSGFGLMLLVFMILTSCLSGIRNDRTDGSIRESVHRAERVKHVLPNKPDIPRSTSVRCLNMLFSALAGLCINKTGPHAQYGVQAINCPR